jgi:hypothetical protein
MYVSFYGSLEEYPKNCFKNCPNLIRTGGTAAAFSGLKRIGESAYEGCTSLVVSANWYPGRYTNLEEIGDNAFKGCTSLTDITLSETVTKIGAGAFDGCTNITNLQLASQTPPQFGQIQIDTMAESFMLKVPDSEADGDAIYLAYREALSQILGQEMTYRILDSVTDGAKERHPLSEPSPVDETEVDETETEVDETETEVDETETEVDETETETVETERITESETETEGVSK